MQRGNINCKFILIRRALESPLLHILFLMLCRSHLELMEKTELGPISLKEEVLLLHPPLPVCVCVYVCVCVHTCQPVYAFLCQWLWACVSVCDWHAVDLSGTAFSQIPCLSTADDWQLICGPEISVLEKGTLPEKHHIQKELVPIWCHFFDRTCVSGW